MRKRCQVYLVEKLISPALPINKDFAELLTELKIYFEPKKAIIVERFNFYCCNQQVREGIILPCKPQR